jgi:hypothetical protein
METILIEKLGSVSMRGGLVRVQCMATGADGEERVSGEMVIPAVAFGQIAGGLQAAGKQLQERIEQARKEQSDQTEQ